MWPTLFDDFERTNPSPRAYDEDTFSFLNRVDQPYCQRIRDALGQWYAEYPDAEPGFPLRARYRDPAPAQHYGAWWELYLYRLFRCLGFEVEVEPDVPGGKPDFRMARRDDSFLVEATTTFSGIVDEERDADREAPILAMIEKVSNPDFYVGVEFEQVGKQTPTAGEITKPLEGWLESLDPDVVLQQGYFNAPTWRLAVRDWKLVFTAFAVSPEARGRPDHRLLGMPPGITGFVNDREKLAASLAAKGGKYKPEEPFVLAVLLMSDGTVDHEDIEAALLGPEFIRLTPTRSNSDARFASRTGSGFEATNRGGPGFPRS